MTVPRMRWPGFGTAGTVVIPIAPATWAPPAAGVAFGDVAFVPKRELHVTVIGSALGARVASTLRESDVAALFAPLDWTFRRTHRLLHLRRTSDGVTEQSLVERIDMPAMAAFHAALAQQLGAPLPVPPPHVTLYVHGTNEGIGIPDEASLARWTVGEIVLP